MGVGREPRWRGGKKEEGDWEGPTMFTFNPSVVGVWGIGEVKTK